MRESFRKKVLFVSYITLLLISFLSISYLLIPYGETGILLLILTLFITIIGLSLGVTYAIGTSLLLFFVVGSFIFWTSYAGVQIFGEYTTMLYLTIWMSGQLIISIFAGSLSTLYKQLLRENKQLTKDLETLVAIDIETGFDNKSRMIAELELEYNRSKRYGEGFSFLIIKWEYYDQFLSLYGEKEVNRTLNHIAKQIFRSSRTSDLKFRVEKDMFALLLPNTDISNIEIVIAKLNKELTVFQLQNQKLVSLTFKYGYAGFEDSMNTYHDILNTAMEQVE